MLNNNRLLLPLSLFLLNGEGKREQKEKTVDLSLLL